MFDRMRRKIRSSSDVQFLHVDRSCTDADQLALTGRRVALLLPQTFHWSRQVMNGVLAFAKQKRSWSVRWFPPSQATSGLIANWQPDGVLASFEFEEQAREILAICRRTVALESPVTISGLPVVAINHKAVGGMAADHFVRRGLGHFACLTLDGSHFSESRAAGFAEYLRHCCNAPCWRLKYAPAQNKPGSKLRDDSEFWNWLKAAPKPLGLFAVDDSLAVEATQTCRGLGLHVPDEIAILGADDNALLCHIADPRLSSVKTPLFQSGFDAATLLDSMFAPHVSQCQTRVMDPIHVTNGASSGVLAVDDSAISEILRRIHSAGGTPLTVKALLKDLSFSRRALEKRFRAAVGCSPMEEVRRVREAQVVQMLLHSDTPIWQVAKECGFGSAVHLSVAFKRSQGLSPREFREQFRRLRKFPLETAGHPRATPSKTKCTNPAVDRPRSTKATVPR